MSFLITETVHRRADCYWGKNAELRGLNRFMRGKILVCNSHAKLCSHFSVWLEDKVLIFSVLCSFCFQSLQSHLRTDKIYIAEIISINKKFALQFFSNYYNK